MSAKDKALYNLMGALANVDRPRLPKFVVHAIRLNLLNIIISILVQIFSRPFLGSFVYLLMLEAALLFLAGGSMDLTSSLFLHRVRQYLSHTEDEWSEEQHRKAQRQGLTYAGAGALLLVESLLLSLV